MNVSQCAGKDLLFLHILKNSDGRLRITGGDNLMNLILRIIKQDGAGTRGRMVCKIRGNTIIYGDPCPPKIYILFKHSKGKELEFFLLLQIRLFNVK